jgi:CHAD domain-containing protein
MMTALHFKFPINLTVQQFMTELSREINSQLVCSQQQLKTYYDSFDWRLYNSGIICEFVQAQFMLKTFKNDAVIASTELNTVPKFFQQFEQDDIRKQLEPLLEMRALLPVYTVGYQYHQLNLINEDNKTILRLIIEEYEQFPHRVLLQPIRGYKEITAAVIKLFTTQLDLTEINKPILLSALEQQGRTFYSSKQIIYLHPKTRADIASKHIYSQLLNTIKDNEQGTIDDIDSEFLHDFRVAVRRTRSALSQLKKLLPDDINSHYAEFFSWLGKITSETRDLDVYLLNFEQYKQDLPVAMRESLQPFQLFLYKKQQQAQQQLATELGSAYYLSSLSAWQQYLEQPILTNCQLTIKELADKRVWKNFKRVLKEGEAISELSPAEALHELRKSCKKLRYLMEFFQSLYAKNKIKLLLNALKGLQEVLGDFQDCTVQEAHLKQFHAEMQAMDTPADTLLAIDSLIDNLDSHKVEIRSHFDLKFAAFTQQEMLDTFKLLFG